jgi:hypothetical protein
LVNSKIPDCGQTSAARKLKKRDECVDLVQE